VSSVGGIDLTLVKEVPASKTECERYSLRNSDILFNNTNSVDLVGKTALFDLDEGFYLFSNHMTRIRVNREIADPHFVARQLFWIWKSGGFQTMVTRWVNQAAINKTMLGGVLICLPALSEQHRIVEILDQADALRKKRVAADAKAARILPALFYRMFGDPATNPKGWGVKPLADFKAQIRYGLGQPPKTSETGVALIRATNISRGIISAINMVYVDPQNVPPSRNAFLKKDEVLVVRSGAYTGDIAQVTKEWEGCVAGYDLVITPGSYLTGEFVESYLLTPFIQKGYFHNLKARAGQPHLNAAQVAATPFLEVPRDLQLQFSEAVRAIRILRKQQVTASENLQRDFSVLLHRAFSGDLTAKWREAHMKRLLQEMEQQAGALKIDDSPLRTVDESKSSIDNLKSSIGDAIS